MRQSAAQIFFLLQGMYLKRSFLFTSYMYMFSVQS